MVREKVDGSLSLSLLTRSISRVWLLVQERERCNKRHESTTRERKGHIDPAEFDPADMPLSLYRGEGKNASSQLANFPSHCCAIITIIKLRNRKLHQESGCIMFTFMHTLFCGANQISSCRRVTRFKSLSEKKAAVCDRSPQCRLAPL